MKDSQNLFEGLKVVDAASFIAGPSAATIMADYGAEVIKIEPPEVGDSLRWLITNGRMPEGKENYCWELTSRNKKSLSLNLKEPEALQILKDLVISADVFVTNMPFPVRKKLKITSEEICPLNERLIYASLTGYGEVGPDADRTAYDSMAWWARSGLMDWVRPSDNSPVAWSTPGMGDHPTGMALYGAIVTWANGVFIQASLMGVEFADRSEPLPRHPFYDFYRTNDNREFALGLINATREWPKLAKAINRTDLLTNPRFEGDALVENAKDLKEELESEFLKMTLDEINQLLRPSGATYGVLGKTKDHEQDPQFLDTETLVPLEHESFGQLLTVNSPFKIGGEDKISFRRAPHIGENTSEILSEMGIDEEAQKKLIKKGAIA